MLLTPMPLYELGGAQCGWLILYINWEAGSIAEITIISVV